MPSNAHLVQVNTPFVCEALTRVNNCLNILKFCMRKGHVNFKWVLNLGQTMSEGSFRMKDRRKRQLNCLFSYCFPSIVHCLQI